MSESSVVKFAPYSGVAANNSEIAEWLRLWADHIESHVTIVGAIVVTVGTNDGDVDAVCSGSRLMRSSEKVGFLEFAKMKYLMGNESTFFDSHHHE